MQIRDCVCTELFKALEESPKTYKWLKKHITNDETQLDALVQQIDEKGLLGMTADNKLFIEKNTNGYEKLYNEIHSLKEIIESSKLLVREKIALFVDSQNLYYSARMGYAAKVNYEKLLRLITGNRNLIKA